ncbi:hypothetical protein OV450_3383 [Actinobacteria bacterium OV450]|nr:hypothetical protein OV450_3383 [Actinobacteria bacterium OV450]
MTDPPVLNQEMFQRIRDQITMYPETHAQWSWEDTASWCGTTRCVAGWALHFTNPNQNVFKTAAQMCPDDSDDYVGEAAAKILGLTPLEAKQLFYHAGDSRAVELVEQYALKGRE